MYGLADHKGNLWHVCKQGRFTGCAAMKALCMVESLSACVYGIPRPFSYIH